MSLFGEGQVVGEGRRVLLVDVGRDLVEARDEGVLGPVHDELRHQDEDAIGRQVPKTVWKGGKKNNTVSISIHCKWKQKACVQSRPWPGKGGKTSRKDNCMYLVVII